tara:strand:- start:21 stop:416 length:396 start_codon:yes stop_codon:yes gene_type:complete
MNIKERKQKIADGFEGLANGESEPLMSLFDSNVSWKIIGTTRFSGTYNGIEDLSKRLLAPIHEALEGNIKLTADNLIGEGNYIVCQGRGQSKLIKGGNYNNIYCWVYRWSGDKIVEVTEYLDTETVNTAFG